jgi:hypothetical protein
MAETTVVTPTVVPTPDAVPLPEEDPTEFDTLVDEPVAVEVLAPADAPIAEAVLDPTADAAPEPAA